MPKNKKQKNKDTKNAAAFHILSAICGLFLVGIPNLQSSFNQ